MADTTQKPKPKPSMATMIVVVLLLTVIGAGTGLGVGAMLATTAAPGPVETAAEAPVASGHGAAETKKDAHGGGAAAAGGHGGDTAADGAVIAAFEVPAPVELDEPMVVVPLAPIITNLAAPAGVWLRIEASLLASAEQAHAPAQLAEEMTAAILAYIRTLKLGDIEGGSGFLAFRDDLDDLVKIASHGAARRVLVKSLVVE